MVPTADRRVRAGCDAAKKITGCKRHILADTDGRLLASGFTPPISKKVMEGAKLPQKLSRATQRQSVSHVRLDDVVGEVCRTRDRLSQVNRKRSCLSCHPMYPN